MSAVRSALAVIVVGICRPNSFLERVAERKPKSFKARAFNKKALQKQVLMRRTDRRRPHLRCVVQVGTAVGT